MNRPTILLVDDTRLLLEIGSSFLACSPIRILTAMNGEDGLELMRKERPDLVVLDQNMPKMTGTTCCAAMRRDPDLVDIPVIMISSTCSPEDQIAFRNAGCTDFMAKPLDRDTFLGKVRRFLPGIDRRSERIPFQVAVELCIDGTLVSGISRDLSLHGLYIASEGMVEPGSRVTLGFRLPDREGAPRITATGRVVWVNHRQRPANPLYPPGFGVEILEITGEGIAMLRKSELGKFMESHGRKGGDSGQR